MTEQVIEKFNESASRVAPIGATIKFLLDDQSVFIDGTGDANVVSGDNKDADCTISMSMEDLMKLQKGELNPMMAVMSGKIKIQGDMGLAMKLQSLLS